MSPDTLTYTKDEDRRNLIKDGIFLHHLANSICGNTAEHLFKYIAKNIKMSIYRMVHKFPFILETFMVD